MALLWSTRQRPGDPAVKETGSVPTLTELPVLGVEGGTGGTKRWVIVYVLKGLMVAPRRKGLPSHGLESEEGLLVKQEPLFRGEGTVPRSGRASTNPWWCRCQHPLHESTTRPSGVVDGDWLGSALWETAAALLWRNKMNFPVSWGFGPWFP